MDRQRQMLRVDLEAMPSAHLWQRAWSGEWPCGEIIDHMYRVNRSFLSLFRLAWPALWPWAFLRRRLPIELDIDNVYLRSDFPMRVGRMWPPRNTPLRPASLDSLFQRLQLLHAAFRKFCADKDPRLLGHVPLWDPAIGKLNLITALRVGVYHDELHMRQIDQTLTAIRQAR
jgi:hypothetical protein